MNARLHVGLADFEGAIQELVGAIRAGKYAIASVPLREITERFLGYVKDAHANEVELGADYIDAASWLVPVKSHSLMPPRAPGAGQ